LVAAAATPAGIVAPKATNFREELQDCTSEGGFWNVRVDSIDCEYVKKAERPTTVLDWATSLVALSADALKYKATASDVVRLCDDIDARFMQDKFASPEVKLLRLRRYSLLCTMLRTDRHAYIETAKFLVGSRIPRSELPNLQLTLDARPEQTAAGTVRDSAESKEVFKESALEKALMLVFRGYVQQESAYKVVVAIQTHTTSSTIAALHTSHLTPYPSHLTPHDVPLTEERSGRDPRATGRGSRILHRPQQQQ
jgi:hypothetical protein